MVSLTLLLVGGDDRDHDDVVVVARMRDSVLKSEYFWRMRNLEPRERFVR